MGLVAKNEGSLLLEGDECMNVSKLKLILCRFQIYDGNFVRVAQGF